MRKSRVKELSMEVTVGAFLFMVLLALGLFTIILSSENFFAKTYRMVVVFEDVLGLRGGDKVLVRGVEVGKVVELRLQEDGVHVDLSLEEQVRLKSDYKVEIVSSSALGGKHVQIYLGGNESVALSSGTRIIGEPPIDIFDEAGEMVKSIREALEEGGILENLQVTMREFREVTTKLSKGEGTLGKLLNDDQVYNDLQQVSSNLRGISQRLADGKGTLGKLLSEDAEMYDSFNAAAKSIRQLTDQINSGEGTLGKLASDDEVYEEIKLLLNDLRATVDDFRETAPITTFSSIFFGAF